MDESSSSMAAEISTIESLSWDHRVADSAAIGWTDEKHSLFLDSIESSFVDQLYCNQYHSNDFSGLLSGSKKRFCSSISHANESKPDQFKVMRRGCWENIRFESAKTQAESKNDCHTMLSSQWIQHFKSPSTIKEPCANAFGVLTDNQFVDLSVQAAGQKHCGKETNLKNLPDLDCIYGEDLIDSKIEMSDQNFVDDVIKVDQQASRICTEMSCTNTQSNGSIIDKGLRPGSENALMFEASTEL